LNDEDIKYNPLRNKSKKYKTNINIVNIGKLKIGKFDKNNCKDNSVKITLNNSYNNIKKNLNNKPTKPGYYINSRVENNVIYKNLNDEELNSLDYSIALKIDKKTYFQYYWSLLKKKHLILFISYPNDDYNLISIKIISFLVSFSLYFTINRFFFNDDTMHKINEDNGNFNLLYQLIQIFYSSVISEIKYDIETIISFRKNILAI